MRMTLMLRRLRLVLRSSKGFGASSSERSSFVTFVVALRSPKLPWISRTKGMSRLSLSLYLGLLPLTCMPGRERLLDSHSWRERYGSNPLALELGYLPCT